TAIVGSQVFHMFIPDAAITVTSIRHAAVGGTSLAWTLVSGAAINSTTTTVESGTASSPTPTLDSSMSGTAAVSAGNCVNLSIGTVTGSVTQFTINVYYTEN
ncbi:MAG TPA: hypothetical protein VFH61_17810, partial [Thermoleophilia bacterium]|nr:hypothetical protein [Thermoleophilia bacterium]